MVNIDTLIFDFDGVIVDSAEIRREGFRHIFKEEPQELVAELMVYHDVTGGISRYAKIRYFFEQLKGENVSDEKVLAYAYSFRDFMLESMRDKRIINLDALAFLHKNYGKRPMYLVSGSDQLELRVLCKALELEDFFIEILGSPVAKGKNLANLFSEYQFDLNTAIYIGDSIEDFRAASSMNLRFLGYNNDELRGRGEAYIESLSEWRTIH